jgi:hypothetical protein
MVQIHQKRFCVKKMRVEFRKLTKFVLQKQTKFNLLEKEKVCLLLHKPFKTPYS